MSGRAVDTYETDVVEHLIFLVDYFPNGRRFKENVHWALGEVKHGDYPKSRRERAKAQAAKYAEQGQKKEFFEELREAEEEIRSGRD